MTTLAYDGNCRLRVDKVVFVVIVVVSNFQHHFINIHSRGRHRQHVVFFEDDTLEDERPVGGEHPRDGISEVLAVGDSLIRDAVTLGNGSVVGIHHLRERLASS